MMFDADSQLIWEQYCLNESPLPPGGADPTVSPYDWPAKTQFELTTNPGAKLKKVRNVIHDGAGNRYPPGDPNYRQWIQASGADGKIIVVKISDIDPDSSETDEHSKERLATGEKEVEGKPGVGNWLANQMLKGAGDDISKHYLGKWSKPGKEKQAVNPLMSN